MTEHTFTVEFERIQEQCPLIAKGVVKTAPAEVQGFNEIFNGSCGISFAPENMQRLDEGFITVEGFGTRYFVPFIPEYLYCIDRSRIVKDIVKPLEIRDKP